MYELGLILGILCGIFLLLLGRRLAKKVKDSFSKVVAYVTPFILFFLSVILINILF